MTEKKNKTISKLKSYHIIVLGCILGTILLFNSNKVNEHKATMKLNQEKSDLFNTIISIRRLPEEEEEGEVIYITTEVCSKSSVDLKEYYKTGDLTKIGLNNNPIESESNDYIKALLDIVKEVVKSSDDDDSENLSGGGSRRLLDLDEDVEKNIKKYANRILPSVAFLVIGLLCIIGWIVCCFCTCCNCCCCCCCKKTNCKIPCFIFTYFFYASVVAVCIYGFSQTNNIFTGINNTECAFLKFFDDILDGEEKETRPKWIGINGVYDMLNSLDETIKDMEDEDLSSQLDYLISEIDEKREEFEPELQSVHKNFYNYDEEGVIEIEPKDEYCIEFEPDDNYHFVKNGATLNLKGKYVLDIVPIFGKYENENYTGLISIWDVEIGTIDREASSSLGDAQKSFSTLLTQNINKIKDGLEDGKKALEKLRKPFDNVYDTLSDVIYDSSLLIDDYGKLGVKLVFGVLGLMNIALAVLLLLICMFSGKSCADCCCCRCLCKLFTHVLWNILALLMILSFILGSLLSLFGLLGADIMEVISYVVSQKNFNQGSNAILLGELGHGRKILEEVFMRNGDLTEAFKLNEVTEDFDVIRNKKEEIQNYIDDFNNLAMNFPAYNYIKSELKNKTDFIDDTCIKKVGEGDGAEAACLFEIIDLLNGEIKTDSDEKWDKENGDENFKCDEEHLSQTEEPNNKKLHPWACEPIYRGWVTDSTNNKLKNYAKISTAVINQLKYVDGTKGNGNQNFYTILDELKSNYEGYLNTYLNVLNFFLSVINRLISAIENAIGNDTHTFSFLNGSFIKTDLKILLKYLKESLGKDVYTVGLCLAIIGFSLILSISSTILLIIVINVSLEENKKFVDQTQIGGQVDYAANNDGRVVQFKNAV